MTGGNCWRSGSLCYNTGIVSWKLLSQETIKSAYFLWKAMKPCQPGSPGQSQEPTLQRATSFHAVKGSWVSPDHPIINSSEPPILCHASLLCAPYALCHTPFHSGNLNIKTGKMSSSLYWLCSLRSIWGCHSSDSSPFQIPPGLKYKKEERIHRIQVHTQVQAPYHVFWKKKGKEEGIWNIFTTFMEIILQLHWQTSELGSVSIPLKGSRSTI